ncbi:hypothetical protein SAMN05216198_0550 [Halopseudomonas litoralis]|uniref:Uncharacterized protein n=1 Tax=Halopseudomonas litoralis TaxID=797277 RepID=A0A1H1M9J3_9GAMM|nr:hypothetical protein [Halopseudomonas litoralis]SDR83416.1 hypothetical protein SAMN05216198_0550 [Halopseudomonas litoralis]
MSTHAATADDMIDAHTGARDLRRFQRRSYSGNLDEQAAFERMVNLSCEVARQLRGHGPGAVAVIAGQVCWVSPLFTADEPLVSAMNPRFENTEFTFAIFPSHTDELDTEELDAISDAIEFWLANPVFRQIDQTKLDIALPVIIERWTDDDCRHLL